MSEDRMLNHEEKVRFGGVMFGLLAFQIMATLLGFDQWLTLCIMIGTAFASVPYIVKEHDSEGAPQQATKAKSEHRE